MNIKKTKSCFNSWKNRNNRTEAKKTKIKHKHRPRVVVDPDVNTMALAQCVTKFMLATEKQIVRKFQSLLNAQTYECGDHGQAVFVPGARGNSALLVAHYDTVWGLNKLRINHEGFTLKSGMKGTGIGADDRAGVAALWMLRDCGHSLLIVPAEEIGCCGSRVIAEKHSDLLELHTFAIQFDRRGGHDLVTYDCENDKFDKYIKQAYTGYDIAMGSFSDISELCPAGKIAGVNVSIGFRNEHTSSENLDLLDFARTLSLTRSLLRRHELPQFEYIDGFGNDIEVWKDIDTASRITAANKAIKDWNDYSDNSQVIWPDGKTFKEHDEDRFERWCYDCGTVCLCDNQLDCVVCGGTNTEAIA